MAIKNTVSIDFDPRSSIVDVFDCRLPGVKKWTHTHLLQSNENFGRRDSSFTLAWVNNETDIIPAGTQP